MILPRFRTENCSFLGSKFSSEINWPLGEKNDKQPWKARCSLRLYKKHRQLLAMIMCGWFIYILHARKFFQSRFYRGMWIEIDRMKKQTACMAVGLAATVANQSESCIYWKCYKTWNLVRSAFGSSSRTMNAWWGNGCSAKNQLPLQNF